MKIIKIIQKYREVSDEEIKSFLYRNLTEEMLVGLEQDDPRTIKRVLRLFGIVDTEQNKAEPYPLKIKE